MEATDTAPQLKPSPRPRVAFDVMLLAEDMAAKGWLAKDLAGAARVSERTVSRFLRQEAQTAKMAAKFASVLGYGPQRYLRRRARAEVTR